MAVPVRPRLLRWAVSSSLPAVWRYRGVLGLLVWRDLTVKYQQSLLGYLWSLIEPLTIAATYWFVFGLLYGERGAGGVPYLLFLASGVFAWMWVASVLNEATSALTAQSGLIKTINLPREIFPLARVLAKSFEFFAALPVVALVALLSDAWPGTRLAVYLPLAVVAQGVLLAGLALLLASLNVMLRDIEKAVRLISRVLFYALPVIYPLHRVLDSGLPSGVTRLYQINPVVGVLELHHAAWTGSQPPGLAVGATVVGGVLVLAAGIWVFRRTEPAVLKEL